MKPYTYCLVAVVIGSFVISSGCQSSGGGGGSGDNNAANPAGQSSAPTTAISTSCSTKIVDPGQKGSTATVARGASSDTAMIPGTSSPAVAYADANAIAIKVTYWTGTSFATEIVSGDGPGANLRLRFLSSGAPIVLWTYGTNLKIAMRSAPLGTAGVWNASVIDTGTAPRATDMAVNPANQIAISFVTDAATTGRAKFLYCDAPCTSPSQFRVMLPNAYIENTAVVANQVATGVAWCNAGSGVYYPAMVYGGNTNQVRYAVCQNSLANCLNNANWTIQTVIAAASLSSRLVLSDAVVGDVPKIVSLKPTVGVKTYAMGTTACNVAPTAFTENTNTIGTSSSGSLWLDAIVDASGKFHIIANESTTNLRYYNSTSTDILGTWNAAGNIETVALPTAIRGGSAIDNSVGGLYTSYGISATAYDLKLARVNDYTIDSGTATYSKFYPDLTGDVLLAAAGSQHRNVAVAKTRTNQIAAAYVDYSIGSAGSAKLKYAIRAAGAGSAWTISIVPNTQTPQFPSIAFDSADRPWIGFFEAASNKFFLVQNSSTDGLGNWNTYEFPATPAGAPVALPAANNTALTMRNTGSTLAPVLVVADNNATSRGIKAAQFNAQTLTWSPVGSLDTLGASGAAHLAADADALGNVVVGFYDITQGRVKYNHSSNGTTWDVTSSFIISGPGRGMGTSIRINRATQTPAITYYEKANNRLYFAACSGTLVSCTTGGWTEALIENGTAGVSTIAANGEQVLATDLEFTPDGYAEIVYGRGQGSSGELMLAHNLSGTFVSSVIGSGVNGALPGSPSLNFGVAAWGIAGTLNSKRSMTSVYVGPGNWLYSTSCGD